MPRRYTAGMGIVVSDEMNAAVEEAAQAQQVSKAEFVRQALQARLDSIDKARRRQPA